MLGNKLKKSGFSLVEVLVATLIFSVSLMGVMKGLEYLNDTFLKSKNTVNKFRMQSAIIENLRLTASQYQVSFDSAANNMQWPARNAYPFAFGDKGIVSCFNPENCLGYPGRMDFRIQAHFMPMSVPSTPTPTPTSSSTTPTTTAVVSSIPSGLLEVHVRTIEDISDVNSPEVDFVFVTSGGGL